VKLSAVTSIASSAVGGAGVGPGGVGVDVGVAVAVAVGVEVAVGVAEGHGTVPMKFPNEVGPDPTGTVATSLLFEVLITET
jgi:hypothetical protein